LPGPREDGKPRGEPDCGGHLEKSPPHEAGHPPGVQGDRGARLQASHLQHGQDPRQAAQRRCRARRRRQMDRRAHPRLIVELVTRRILRACAPENAPNLRFFPRRTVVFVK